MYLHKNNRDGIWEYTGFSVSFKEGGKSEEIKGDGADISHFICKVWVI